MLRDFLGLENRSRKRLQSTVCRIAAVLLSGRTQSLLELLPRNLVVFNFK